MRAALLLLAALAQPQQRAPAKHRLIPVGKVTIRNALQGELVIDHVDGAARTWVGDDGRTYTVRIHAP